MISKEELEHVSKWPRQTPFPNIDYVEETFEQMIRNFKIYNEYYFGKSYNIIFKDNSNIEFEILNSNICSMLGIDYKGLISGYHDKFLSTVLKIKRNQLKLSSYEMVIEILKHYKKIIKFEQKTGHRIINYYKCRINNTVFEKINEIEKNNFFKTDTNDKSKILIIPSEDKLCPFFLVRLTRDNSHKKYGVSSLLAPTEEKLKTYLQFDIKMPQQIQITDATTKKITR